MNDVHHNTLWRRRFVNELNVIDPSTDSSKFLSKRRELLPARPKTLPENASSKSLQSQRAGNSSSHNDSPPKHSPTAHQPLETRWPRIEKVVANILPKLRNQFFEMSEKELRHYLNKLVVLDFAIYKKLAIRLQIVASQRHTLKSIVELDPSMATLVSSFQMILVGESDSAVMARNSILQRAEDPNERKQILSQIRKLQLEAPLLYELESQWFDNLLFTHRKTILFGRYPRVNNRVRDVLMTLLFAATLFSILIATAMTKDPKYVRSKTQFNTSSSYPKGLNVQDEKQREMVQRALFELMNSKAKTSGTAAEKMKETP